MTDPTITHADAATGADESGVLAVFHNRPVQDERASQIEGRPVFKSEAYVKILIPGDARAIQIERLNEGHKRRWPKVWEAFQAKQTGVVDGTPIEQWPLLTAVQVATLRAQGIVTVEQLAGVTDSRLTMGLPRDLRTRAQQWLQGPSETEKALRRENAEMKEQIQSMSARLDLLQKTLERLGMDVAEPAPPKRRGRPRKNGGEAVA